MNNSLIAALKSLATIMLTVSAVAQGGPPADPMAWGQNNFGQTNVPGLTVQNPPYHLISAGRWHSAGLRDDGTIICWGRNDEGQCNVPTLPAGILYDGVSAGGWHTIGVRTDGSAIGWGRNTDGQCNVPTPPEGIGYLHVIAGGYHTLALRDDGVIVAVGQNYQGQCNVPPLPPGITYIDVAAGLLHSVALRSDLSVVAWGQNSEGQTNVPALPPGVFYDHIAAGHFHSLALRTDGNIVAWGSNSDGQSNVPALPPAVQYVAVAGGAAHTVAHLTDGSVQAWGRNWEGQCDVPSANGSVGSVDRLTFALIAAGGNHTLALPTAGSHEAPDPRAPHSLRFARIPKRPGLSTYINDNQWAVVLGKSLFWDQQAGSDGMACANCHYHAGADNRVINQISPKLGNTWDPTQTGTGGPNYLLRKGDFPFYVLQDPNDRESPILFNSDDVVSSSGAFKSDFVSGPSGTMFDQLTPVADPLFEWNGRNTRQVPGRNTPTTINAVFMFRTFWDGRANNEFNGVDPFGPRNPNAFVAAWNGQALDEERMSLRNSALASQAVGPIGSNVEMACAGRVMSDVADKLLTRTALAYQQVAYDDSVLGSHVAPSGTGLTFTYEQLIRLAFANKYWSAPANATTSTGKTQMQHNFSMFWGLAIQAYESTLISDETRYDAWAEGDVSALTADEIQGLQVFLGKGKCINCHGGPDWTNAGLHLQPEFNEEGLVERMHRGDGTIVVYDNAFYNIGVRPTHEDLGVGGDDPWGNPLSWTKQWLSYLNMGIPLVDDFHVDPNKFETRQPLRSAPTVAQLQAAYGNDPHNVDGAFKTAGLRNVELTGPYFHNGGTATLEGVVEFYNRGGNVRSNEMGDTSGFGPNSSNLAPDIRNLDLTTVESANLVKFLKSLTDERVRWEMAPFDHPQLGRLHGHSNTASPEFGPVFNKDEGDMIPAVGAGGRVPLNLPPLKSFEAALPN
jgi:cytochrome c peroxidase